MEFFSEDLIESLERLLEARKAKDKAIGECGYDADYFCREEILEERRAKEDFIKNLKEFVDGRVRLILENYHAFK